MKGILFRPGMIQAIVNGSKTQTRRVIKHEHLPDDVSLYLSDGYLSAMHPKKFHGWFWVIDDKGKKIKPRYQVGQVVDIKEGIHRFNVEYASYDSDYTPVMFLGSANRFHWRWQRDKLSPMFLPHDAARYFIRITDVKVERLQEITEKEAEAEGCNKELIAGISLPSAKRRFSYLWDTINKPPYDWQSNPFVWRYSFVVERKEIENQG